ncbi:unnamed protein product [Prorocentrum cordatum]|uniref:ATPase AAA-type core domain-containing protein n=1 Tax=Prorocentrum cordatum TaxID=2364126 RepID=A0ABN9VIX3_9DINO|nr:unnamed protein product [Polarella glacialis]
MVLRLARKFKRSESSGRASLSLGEYLEQVALFRRALRLDYNVGDFLKQVDLSGVPELTWNEYYADDEIKAQLRAISESTPADEQVLRRSVYGSNGRPSGPPIVLLHGPPGTGKTQGMRVVAAQTKKTLYMLSLKGLVGQNQIRDLFGAICLRYTERSKEPEGTPRRASRHGGGFLRSSPVCATRSCSFKL